MKARLNQPSPAVWSKCPWVFATQSTGLSVSVCTKARTFPVPNPVSISTPRSSPTTRYPVQPSARINHVFSQSSSAFHSGAVARDSSVVTSELTLSPVPLSLEVTTLRIAEGVVPTECGFSLPTEY